MKKIIYLIFFNIACIYSTSSLAQNFIDLDLISSISVSAVEDKYHKEEFLRCSRNGPAHTSTSVGPLRLDSNSRFRRRVGSSTMVTSELSVAYTPQHNYNARSMAVNTILENYSSGSIYKVQIFDTIKWQQADIDSGACSSSNWIAKASNSGVVGFIKFIYKMPDNAWAAKISLSKVTGVFSGKLAYLDSPESVFSKQDDSDIIVWAKPGEFVNLAIASIGPDSNLISGEVEYKVEPLVFDAETIVRYDSSLLSSSLDDLMIQIEGSPQSSKDKDREVVHQLIKLANAVSLENGLSGQILENTSTSDLVSLKSKVRKAYSYFISENTLNLYRAITLIELALNIEIEKRFSSYCASIKIDMLSENKRVNVSAEYLASLYIRRSINITNDLPIEAFGSYLNMLRILQDQGLSFKDVRRDREKISQLSKGYSFINSLVKGLNEGLEGTALEFKYLKSTLTLSDTNDFQVSEIINQIEFLNSGFYKIKYNLESFLEQFNSLSPLPINVDSFYKDLEYLKEKKANLLKLLHSGLSFIGSGRDSNNMINNKYIEEDIYRTFITLSDVDARDGGSKVQNVDLVLKMFTAYYDIESLFKKVTHCKDIENISE